MIRNTCSRRPVAWSLAILFLVGACARGPCRSSQPSVDDSADTPCSEVFVSDGNPYAEGPLAVRTARLSRCENGAPLDLLVSTPQQPGAYAVVVFQHGFLLANTSYSGMLRHLAGHGFVAVAPQTYGAGVAPLLGSPTAAQEAAWAATVLDWLPRGLPLPDGVRACVDRLGLAGHSRGGKVAWLVLSEDPSRAVAVAGVDPVDGTGGPCGGQDRVVDGPFDFTFRSLVIGTGLGGHCAPEGDNHEQFYAASAPPAWHVVVPNQGHVDMLDEDATGFSLLRATCGGGDDFAGMRTLTAGLLTAFFRGALQGDPNAFAWLTDTTAAPIPIEVEAR